MGKRTTLTAGATSPTTNLQTLSTGTIHSALDGVPLCPARPRTSTLGETQEPVTCKSCLKLAPVEIVEAPAVDIVGLTDDQLDGIACIKCSREDIAMVPAGVAERGQLFECKSHTREYGMRGTVNTPDGMKLRILAGKAMVMTPELAAELAAELQNGQRREGSPVDAVVVSRIPGGEWCPELATEACKPWCVRHDNRVGLCFGADLPVPSSGYGEPVSIGISYEPTTGTVIAIGDTYLPIEDAVQLALALGRQIDRAHESAMLIAGVA